MDREGEWLELSVEVDQEAVEAVSELFARHGYQEGVVIEEPFRPAADRVTLERDPGGPITVRTYLHQGSGPAQTVGQIQGTLNLLGQLRPIGPLRVRTLREEDWGEAWKAYYPVVHLGKRIVVVPAWRRFRPRQGQIAITMDPGMAFGTGLHPTTQLCLQVLERTLRPGMRVLDLGTGSGILAIAAAKLGSGPVLALDTDPVAVQAARRNIRRNRLSQQIEVRQGTLEVGMEPFDLILANLLARALRELASRLAAALTAGGIVVGSGVLVEQSEEVGAALAAAGLRLLEQPCQGDWVALVAGR